MDATWQPAPGSAAALIHELTLALYAGCALIFVFVMALLLRAVFQAPRTVNERRWLVVGGLAFPGTVLALLLAYALAVGHAVGNFNGQGMLRFLLDCISDGARALSSPASRTLRIEVRAHQWWWEVNYFDGTQPIALANELHLPAGRAAELLLVTDDVIHSFWVPSLAGKVDMIPGRRNRLLLKADAPGVHRGVCAEYCGGQHALMAMHVVVEAPPEFERWLARQARPAAEPADDFLALGRDAFLRADCAQCHTVRGVATSRGKGPDLTHVGSRIALGAGTLDNHVGTLGGWIAGTQALKPGSLMPETRALGGRELRALSAWLESLE
jgi:cytochrome c oxidase subunit 2